MSIQAIQTRYKGYHFRSRLEARWAVFFDVVGIRWEYEPQGFELSGGVKYLPDFKLLNLGKSKNVTVYAEVKPEGMPQPDRGFAKAKLFAKEVDLTLLLEGPPGPFGYALFGGGGFIFHARFVAGGFVHNPQAFCDGGFSETVLHAIDSARSARFEHGECGAT